MFGLKANLRLRTQADFDHVFSRANTLKTAGFRLLWCKSQQHYPRLGIIISKRQVKHAVTRNQIRRQIRESFRLIQHQLAGFDIIILVNHQAAVQTRVEQRQRLEQLWHGLTAV